MEPISSKITLTKQKERRKKKRARRKKGGEEEKAMVAPLVSFNAKGPFEGKVFKNPARNT